MLSGGALVWPMMGSKPGVGTAILKGGKVGVFAQPDTCG